MGEAISVILALMGIYVEVDVRRGLSLAEDSLLITKSSLALF